MENEEYYRKELQKVFDSLDSDGIAGSHVWKDDKGIIHVEFLTAEQCLDVLTWDVIPEEITITKLEKE